MRATRESFWALTGLFTIWFTLLLHFGDEWAAAPVSGSGSACSCGERSALPSYCCRTSRRVALTAVPSERLVPNGRLGTGVLRSGLGPPED